jgi:hypothetical protein
MKNSILILAFLILFPVLVLGGEKEEAYLKQTMIPQARELLLRIGQTNDLPSTTNQVQSYKVDYFDDPPGWLANMQLTNGWVFRFLTEKGDTNVSAFHLSGEKEETYLKEKMIPLAQEFLQRIGQTNNLPLGTNQVKSYKLNYFDDRPGCTADMRLANGYAFSFHTETNQTEIWSFQRNIKTYYALEGAPKEKVGAVKALNLQNKLNKESALVLAKKYFKMIGHKEENFHPPELLQSYWSGEEHGGRLPYYEITWYRKDVAKAEIENHDSNAELKTVIIEVSGINSSLISYSKGLLPIGSDF